jgi:hypothetical protein
MAKKYLSSIRPNGIYEEPKLNNKMREEETSTFNSNK